MLSKEYGTRFGWLMGDVRPGAVESVARRARSLDAAALHKLLGGMLATLVLWAAIRSMKKRGVLVAN